MASLRKTNMPAADMPRFLYTILKQLDLKSVDWNAVAKENSVSNGHACRMRYTRFRQQMEGHIPSRRPRTAGGGGAKRGPKPKRPRSNGDDPISTKKEESESQKIKTESQEGDEDNTDADGELDETTDTPFSGRPEIERRVERLRGSTASTSLSPVPQLVDGSSRGMTSSSGSASASPAIPNQLLGSSSTMLVPKNELVEDAMSGTVQLGLPSFNPEVMPDQIPLYQPGDCSHQDRRVQSPGLGNDFMVSFSGSQSFSHHPTLLPSLHHSYQPHSQTSSQSHSPQFSNHYTHTPSNSFTQYHSSFSSQHPHSQSQHSFSQHSQPSWSDRGSFRDISANTGQQAMRSFSPDMSDGNTNAFGLGMVSFCGQDGRTGGVKREATWGADFDEV